VDDPHQYDLAAARCQTAGSPGPSGPPGRNSTSNVIDLIFPPRDDKIVGVMSGGTDAQATMISCAVRNFPCSGVIVTFLVTLLCIDDLLQSLKLRVPS